MSKKYYAKYNHLGLDWELTTSSWQAFIFDTIQERDEWLSHHDYDGRQYVATKCTKKEAYKIAGYAKHKSIVLDNGLFGSGAQQLLFSY